MRTVANRRTPPEALRGSPSGHPPSGVESRALRRLQRESADSPFVFASERGAPFSTAGFRKMIAQLGKVAGFKFGVHPTCCAMRAASSWPTTETKRLAPLLTRLNEEDKVIRLRLTRLSGDGGHLRQQIALLRKERDPHFAFEGSSTSRTSKTG